MNVHDSLLEQKLWQREKYWQPQLFTLRHGFKSLHWIGIVLIGKVIENDLSMYFPNGTSRLLDFDYNLKYQYKTFYFKICKAIKKDTLLFGNLLV